MGRLRPTDHHNNTTEALHQHQRPVACLSRTTSSSSPSNNDTTVATASWQTMDSHNLDLVLSVSPNAPDHHHGNQSTQLQLSIGSSDVGDKNVINETSCVEQLRMAMADKEYAEEARREAKRQVEVAEGEFANAKRIRQQAQAELEKARALKEQSVKQISSMLVQITCHACKERFHAATNSVLVTSSSVSDLDGSRIQNDDNRK